MAVMKGDAGFLVSWQVCCSQAFFGLMGIAYSKVIFCSYLNDLIGNSLGDRGEQHSQDVSESKILISKHRKTFLSMINVFFPLVSFQI